mmetsp:Transcript_21123/g.66895  ORF Transcript_21123/g.66895 Transcript_21123/m.66895 type:complete len:243 (-) Transcript_21123:2517-3245(-)
MLSVPHSTTAIDSGQAPPLTSFSLLRSRSTTMEALWSAAPVGMDWGSSAWMFLPVGRTSGLRMGSPPGPGMMYLPLRASTRAWISLSLTTCSRQNCRYSNTSFSSSLLAPANWVPLRGFSYEGFCPNMAPMELSWDLVTRPAELVTPLTKACTISRDIWVMSCCRFTSSSTPASLPRYTVSMSLPAASARMAGMPRMGGSASGRSMPAMLTRVATASSAVGATPTTCRPQGRRRDSISISLP